MTAGLGPAERRTQELKAGAELEPADERQRPRKVDAGAAAEEVVVGVGLGVAQAQGPAREIAKAGRIEHHGPRLGAVGDT